MTLALLPVARWCQNALVLCVGATIALAFTSISPAFAQQKSAEKFPYAYGAKYWRHKKGAITDADRERMAKFTAYQGGRKKGQGLPLGKDPYFRKNLAKNRLQYVDSIDKENGLQVTLVKDLDTGRYIILPRGSEFDDKSGDQKKDAKADVGEILSGQLKVGKAQYESGRKKIAAWIAKYKSKGKIEVIGHSLGGTIAQRIALDFGKDLTRVTVFNSPGIEVETVAQALSTPSKMKGITNPDGSSKINIYNAESDRISKAGDIELPANVVVAFGGKLENGAKAAHSQLIFADGVMRTPLGWENYSHLRAFIRGKKTRVWGWVVDRYNNPEGGKEGNLENVPFTITRLAAYHKAILREVRKKEREARRKKAKTDKNALKKAALAKVAREKNAIDEGRKPKVKRKPKPKAVATKKPKPATPKPALKTKAKPAPIPQRTVEILNEDFAGSFTGTQIDLAYGAKIKGGRFRMTVDGTRVTGSADGNLVFEQTVNPFNAKATGQYDALSGKISGTLDGRWHGPGGGGLIQGWFKGVRDKDGFHGNWKGNGIAGRWTASVSRVQPQSWDAYMCQHYRSDFVRMGGKCP